MCIHTCIQTGHHTLHKHTYKPWKAVWMIARSSSPHMRTYTHTDRPHTYTPTYTHTHTNLEGSLDELAVLVAAVLGDLDLAAIGSCELLEFLLHALAELAPIRKIKVTRYKIMLHRFLRTSRIPPPCPGRTCTYICVCLCVHMI